MAYGFRMAKHITDGTGFCETLKVTSTAFAMESGFRKPMRPDDQHRQSRSAPDFRVKIKSIDYVLVRYDPIALISFMDAAVAATFDIFIPMSVKAQHRILLLAKSY